MMFLYAYVSLLVYLCAGLYSSGSGVKDRLFFAALWPWTLPWAIYYYWRKRG